MMTLCLAALGSPGRWLKIFSGKLKSLFLMNVVFVALSLLFFAGFVSYELWATHADMMDYVHSVYTLNSEKFIFRHLRQGSAFAALQYILDLPMAGVYILLLSWFPLLLMLHDRRKHLFKCVVLFVGLTILFNASFPAYSNGVIWSYYFIPSAMAIALYITVVVICLLHCVAPVLQAADRPRQRLDVHQGLAASQLALASVLLLFMAVPSVLDVRWMVKYSDSIAKKMITGSDEPFFRAQRLMPSDLRYWIFRWNQKPVAAPAWGYFVQFGNNRGFWRKMHRLGVSPDPVTHWRDEYAKSPPDAITVSSLKALKNHARRMKAVQNIDALWLVDRVRKDYSCITKVSRRRPFLIRNDLAQAYLQKGGWRLCGEGGG